jgi:Domain of unknown function (DUF6429)
LLVEINVLDRADGEVVARRSYYGGPDYEFVVAGNGQVYFQVVLVPSRTSFRGPLPPIAIPSTKSISISSTNMRSKALGHKSARQGNWQLEKRMELDMQKIDDAVLALLVLGRHDGARAWKGFDWEAMNRLHEKGYITDSRGKAKSLVFTEEGFERAQLLLEKLFSKQAEPT